VESELVEVHYTKWGGIDHWHFIMHRLGEDQFGWWFFGRQGIRIQRGDEPPVTQLHDFVLLVPVVGNWTACFNAENEMEIYADVTTRPVVTSDQVTAVDLDLDVVRYRDGRVAVLDEDEFADHQVRLAYPAELIAGAQATCDELVSGVSQHTEPFGQAGPTWLAKARSAR
jgi:hypothetical protein